MKPIVIYTVSFVVILGVMTFFVAKFQSENSRPDALKADSLASDSTMIDSTELKKQLVETTIQRQKQQIDSLQTLLVDVQRQKETLSETVEKTRAAVQEKLKREFEKRTKEMAKIYENMSPEEAAAIIGQLDNEIAVSVISKMKKRKAAKIMEALDPAKAVQLSEYMASVAR